MSCARERIAGEQLSQAPRPLEGQASNITSESADVIVLRAASGLVEGVGVQAGVLLCLLNEGFDHVLLEVLGCLDVQSQQASSDGVVDLCTCHMNNGNAAAGSRTTCKWYENHLHTRKEREAS